MAKNKPSQKKGNGISNASSVPHVSYVSKFWRDYSDEEWHGLIPFKGKKRPRGWEYAIFALVFFLIMASAVIALIINMMYIGR
jgi:hypothetical protein